MFKKGRDFASPIPEATATTLLGHSKDRISLGYIPIMVSN